MAANAVRQEPGEVHSVCAAVVEVERQAEDHARRAARNNSEEQKRRYIYVCLIRRRRVELNSGGASGTERKLA